MKRAPLTVGAALLLAVAAGCGAPPPPPPAPAISAPASPATPEREPAAAVGEAAPAKAADRALCSEAGWCWLHPFPQGNRLDAVWGTNADDLYAVGTGGTVLHFDGRAWEAEATGVEAPLLAVHGAGSTVVAVGWGGVIVVRGADGRWKKAAGERKANLYAVWVGADDFAVAVGSKGIAYHFDGATWVPKKTGVDGHLRAVWGASPDAIYAGGSRSMAAWDGKRWKKVRVGTIFQATVHSIWGRAADDVFAVGYDRGKGAMLHYDGSTWSPRALGSDNLGTLFAVSGGADRVVAAGSRSFVVGDGAAFRAVDTPRENFRGAWTDGKTTVAVGDHGLTYRLEGDVLTPTSKGAPTSLSGVWGSADDNVFAVGFGGTVLRYDGARFESMEAPTTAHLRAAWGASADAVFAVGDGGEAIRFDGSSWKKVKCAARENLQAMWGSGPDDVWAVGRKGQVVHFTGASFGAVDAQVDQHLTAVHGSAPDNVWAVGRLNTVLRYDGTRWSSNRPKGTEASFYAVLVRSPNDVLIAGDGGEMHRFDGQAWTRIETGFERGVTAMADFGGDTMVVGAFGLAAVGKGGTYVKERSGMGTSFRALWVSPSKTAFAVGPDGAVLRRRPR